MYAGICVCVRAKHIQNVMNDTFSAYLCLLSDCTSNYIISIGIGTGFQKQSTTDILLRI